MSNDLRQARVDSATTTAQDEVRRVHGNAENKAVTATATLNVTSTENGKTVNDGVEVTVGVKTTHSETDESAKS